ncbi:MAG: SpaA isopeptide-forming pilin-related protein [Coprococcus comes]
MTLSYAGQNVEVVFSETTFTNDRQKAKVTVTKKDQDTENPLDGGVFGLYANSDIIAFDGTVIVKKGTLIEKAVTGDDGTAAFTADLPIGFSYCVKEEQAPEGYLRNTKDVYSFAFSYTNDSEAVVSFSHTFTNERVNAKISLHKKDAETNQAVPQGDATLENAVYGLYAREDIVHPDGATGVIYKAGEKVATLTTDEHGEASVDNLYLGSYYVKEITPPTGYLADENEYGLVCSYEGDLVATVERECTSQEQVVKQPFQIIKAADNGKTDADLLSGAGFTAYLVSSLSVKEDGNYDFSSATPVVIGENGATEIFTDEKGYACSIAIPYGTYIVRETTTPHNYTPVDDFIVRITEHHPNTPQVWRVLLDDEFEAKLKIVKQDDETKKPVLAKNTEFKIYDLDNEQYVEQVTTYPTTVVHKSYFTDEQGYLILPQNLKIGHYRIEEINAPYGYTLNENYYEVAVDSNTAYQMDSVSGDVVIEVIYENHPVKGELKVVKRGEVLDGFDKNFTYKEETLEGAVFEVYAAEDIYTADFQKDSDGNRILEYAADALVATLTTDENGEAYLSDLPLGSYRIVEVTAPEGFVLNESAQTVTFTYADQNTPVVKQEAVFTNERQKVEVSVIKQDAVTKAEVAGAVFGLYAKEDILSHGEVIVEADTLLGKALSEEDGKAVFALDVPFGNYYIKELTAPAGYVSSDQVLELTASYQGQDVKVVELESVFENEPTRISVKKTDLTTGVELSGATLTVLDKDGNVVDTWKSVKGEEHMIERLTVGETYTLREELAPYGYLQAEEITFTVEDTAEVQKVEMKDDVPTGLLLINKKGEFLENVSVMDSVGGWIAHLFEYISGSLKDVTFEVYALEDIKAADGESEDYYKKDELIAEITTDDTGVARLSDLPLGKYYVKEKETADGYVLDGEIREIDLTYRDQNTEVVTYSSDWQNLRQKVEVSVLKKEKDSDRVLEGAVFALAANEDITNKDGKVIMEAGTVIEERATDKDGKLTFTADLPIGFSYSVKETVPAPGFATTDEVQEFIFTYEDAEKESVSFAFTFEDEPTVFEFTKTSLTDGKEVEGAKLRITDEDGNVVEEWTSGKEPYIIKELVVGKEYTMTETLPADGYVTAENITFTVEDTAEVQKIEMKDDVTKVEISKTDISGKELPGAKLTILDKDGNVVESWTSTEEPHYIEMLPIGEYTLREESAPEGYLVAEDVKFEVKDTGEIQKVVMKDEVKPEETPQTSSDTPKTGDDTHAVLWIILCGLAFAGLAGSVVLLRRKKK